MLRALAPWIGNLILIASPLVSGGAAYLGLLLIAGWLS